MSSDPDKSSPNLLTASTPNTVTTVEALLNTISTKLAKAEVLNGGFDKMQKHLEELKQDVGEVRTEIYKVNVDLRTITLQNTEFKEGLGKLNDAIYHPDNGIYTRIQKTASAQDSRDKKMDKALEKIDNVEKIIVPLQRTQDELTEIAGKDLQELENIVKTRAVINRMFWLMVVALLGAGGKGLWEFVATHIK
jgi:DNA repair ATPase RecN